MNTHQFSVPFILIIMVLSLPILAQKRDYYELRTYHCSSEDQIDRTEHYLESALIPLAHDLGLTQVGVFKHLANDTARQKRLFVLIVAPDFSALERLGDHQVMENQLSGAGQEYLLSKHDNPAFDRIEISWLRAFSAMPNLEVPKLSSAGPHVFELRSYEGASEILYRKKVDMFNVGGEIELFDDLGFNAIFYAETLAGPRTPNLVYMTSFDDMESRNVHWDSFRNDPRWKKMSSLEKYQNTVSKADIYLLEATPFSDIK